MKRNKNSIQCRHNCMHEHEKRVDTIIRTTRIMQVHLIDNTRYQNFNSALDGERPCYQCKKFITIQKLQNSQVHDTLRNQLLLQRML